MAKKKKEDFTAITVIDEDEIFDRYPNLLLMEREEELPEENQPSLVNEVVPKKEEKRSVESKESKRKKKNNIESKTEKRNGFIKLSDDLYTKAKLFALKENKSINALLEDLIVSELKSKKPFKSVKRSTDDLSRGFGFSLPKDVFLSAKEYCIRTGITMNHLIVYLLITKLPNEV